MGREKFLTNVALFSGLNHDSLRHLAEACSEKRFAAEEVLIRQGEIGNSLFIVVSGTVKIVKLTDDNRMLDIALCGPGEFFGEMSVLDSAKRSASIIAVEETECLVLKSNDFLPLLQEHPEITLNLLPVVVKRFRETNQQLLHLNSRLDREDSEKVRSEEDVADVQDIRSLLVDITSLALRYWMQTTGKTKIELAQESDIWTASIDQYGTYSTRTLDRYLNINKLPQNPRWQNVLRTGYFTLQNCPNTAHKIRLELEDKINHLESLQSRILY
ncbi:cyclic nucleotide-binding domain-containing protein [bacterium]|nr:cyclic nucleotide-binding domain-containing protein [bacterium]